MSLNHSIPPESVMNQLQDGGGLLPSNHLICKYDPINEER